MNDRNKESFSIPNEEIFGANFGVPSAATLERRRQEEAERAQQKINRAYWHDIELYDEYCRVMRVNYCDQPATSALKMPGIVWLKDAPVFHKSKEAWIAAGRPMPEEAPQ